MEERRRTPRIKEVNEVTITVISDESHFPKEKIINNFTKDISAGGVKLQTNILLPVDTLIALDFTSKGLQQRINAIGKVKWVKIIIEDESYEAGVEFTTSNPRDAIKKLEDYIAWKLQSNKSEFIRKKISPVDSDDQKIANVEESFKKTQWSSIVLLLLCTMILVVILLTFFKSIPEFDKLKSYFGYDSFIKETIKLSPRTAVSASKLPDPLKETTSSVAKESVQNPATEAVPKAKVIGNSDTQRYHLPGMKYYNAVEDYHRVEFDSEADAIKAGYRKAKQ